MGGFMLTIFNIPVSQDQSFFGVLKETVNA
jgi:hypothetical protein